MLAPHRPQSNQEDGNRRDPERKCLFCHILTDRETMESDGCTRWWIVSPRFVDSEEFAVVAVSLLTLVGLAGPLLFVCYTHLAEGHFALGCSFGILGITVTSLSGSVFYSSLQRARRKFSGS